MGSSVAVKDIVASCLEAVMVIVPLLFVVMLQFLVEVYERLADLWVMRYIDELGK